MDLPDSFKKRDLNTGQRVSDFEIVLKNTDIKIFLPG